MDTQVEPRSAPILVAVVQAAPVFLDREAVLEMACEQIVDAGRAGAQLILFPHSFLPAYPDWMERILPKESDLLTLLRAKLLDQAVAIPSQTTDRLCRTAQKACIRVVIGIWERVEGSERSLSSTQLVIDSNGNILRKQRKHIQVGDGCPPGSEGCGKPEDTALLYLTLASH